METIPAEKKDLEVHVDLCTQRYEEVRKELRTLKAILIVLIIEASVSAAAAFPTLVPMVRELLQLFI